jgi:hypothetical protein
VQHTRMLTYSALFFSYCPLLFSAISIHMGFNSFYHSSHKFSLPKDLLKLNYSALLHIYSSNEQTHSAGDGHDNMALVLIVCKTSSLLRQSQQDYNWYRKYWLWNLPHPHPINNMPLVTTRFLYIWMLYNETGCHKVITCTFMV